MARLRRRPPAETDREAQARQWLVRKHGTVDDRVLLEEYKAVRAEVTTSLQAQISVLAFGAATLGFAFAAAAQTSSPRFRDMFLLVLVPLLCYLVLTVWFAEVMRMLRAGAFLMRLEKRLDEDFGYGALTWESTIFQVRCRRGPGAFFQDPDRFRMLAIALLFWTIAGTSIVIGWSAVAAYSWQHIFAVTAFGVSIAALVWLYMMRVREAQMLARPLLRKGDEGQDVIELQGVLRAEDLYKGRIDGEFGPDTQHALRTFQQKNALYADGIVGLPTRTLLLQKRRAFLSTRPATTKRRKNRRRHPSHSDA